MKKILCVLAFLLGFVVSVNAQISMFGNSQPYSTATQTISNKSEYDLTVKVMNANGGVYETLYIFSNSSRLVTFSRSGRFYTKTKAEKDWSTTLYRKGGIFDIQNDEEGYSQATLTFYVSSSGGASGQGISRSEFESNN